ncbi:MAG: type IV secretory system conjugative DNA transfer family protein [Gemmataceae bacterium]
MAFLAFGALVYFHLRRQRWKPSGWIYGTAVWSSLCDMIAAGMTGTRGLLLGRSLEDGRLLRIPNYTHVLVVGGTGVGKGVSFVIPQLLDHPGPVICLDVQGDLYEAAAARRRAIGQRVIRLAPLDGGMDTFNPLDGIKPGPLLIDHAKQLADAMIVRTGHEPDPHWLDRAGQVLHAVMVWVLLTRKAEERNLNTVQDIICDPDLLLAVGNALVSMGGLESRLGHQIKTLFSVVRE